MWGGLGEFKNTLGIGWNVFIFLSVIVFLVRCKEIIEN